LVVDESHQVLTCREYRHHFAKLKNLAKFAVQKIYLTASLPPHLMHQFFTKTNLPESTVVIRAPTHQLNMRYHVVTTESTSTTMERFVIDLAALLTISFLGPSRRGIIFCISKDTTDLIGKAFDNCVSHSDLEASVRQSNEESWFIGHHQWIVATTGLIHGIDCQDVGAIIFVELPYGALNLYQGFGRAGRNNQPAMGFLINSKTFLHIPVPDSSEDLSCLREGTLWMHNIVDCRRTGFSALMDGNPTSCSELPDAQLCDICAPNTPLIQAVNKIIIDPSPNSLTDPATTQSTNQSTRSGNDDYDMGGWDDDTLMQIDLDAFSGLPKPTTQAQACTTAKPIQGPSSVQLSSGSITPSMSIQLDNAYYHNHVATKLAKSQDIDQMTSHLLGKCFICWAWKDRMITKKPEHQYFIGCKDNTDKFLDYGVGWMAFKKLYKLGGYLYCWKCGLPQGQFLPSSHPSFQQGQKMQCPLDDLVVTLLWFIRHDRPLWVTACQAFPSLGLYMTLKEFAGWIGNESGSDGFYNGLELVRWYWLKKNHSG
jgi:hypothetical protein